MKNISRHPLIKQSYDLIQAIEMCGASPALTAAVVKAGELMEAIDKHIPDQSHVDSGLNFGAAIETMKQGFRVARAGWNGKGMFLQLTMASDYRVRGANDVALLAPDVDLAPWIGMKTADNKFVPWLASQTDMLAEDWTVLP